MHVAASKIEGVHRHDEIEHAKGQALHHDIDVVDLTQLEVVTIIMVNTLMVLRPHEHCANGEGVVTRGDHVKPMHMFTKDSRLDELCQSIRRCSFTAYCLKLHDSLLEQIMHAQAPQLSVSGVLWCSEGRGNLCFLKRGPSPQRRWACSPAFVQEGMIGAEKSAITIWVLDRK